MVKLYPGYYSDKITELTFSISTVILSGKGWRLICRHDQDYEPEYSSSSIYFQMSHKRRMMDVFELCYNDSGGKPTSAFIADDYRGYTADQLASVDRAEIKRLLEAGREMLGDISDANQIVTCLGIPDEVRQWIIMNGVNNLGPDLEKARKDIGKLAKPVFKTALADKLKAGRDE